MRRRRGIAQQDDILMMPGLTEDTGEIDPRRSPDVVGIGHKGVAAEMILEDLFAQGDAFLLVQVGKAKGVERGL